MAKNKEFLVCHPSIWSEHTTRRSKKQTVEELSHKVKSKTIRLNIVIENHILCWEEMLLEWDSLFTSAVCTSTEATLLYIKIDDILKFISQNDFYYKMKDYWYNVLSLLSKNLDKCINLEVVNNYVKNYTAEVNSMNTQEFEDISNKIYINEELQFYKSLRENNIINPVYETVQRYSDRSRVNSPTLFYRQLWLDTNRK